MITGHAELDSLPSIDIEIRALCECVTLNAEQLLNDPVLVIMRRGRVPRRGIYEDAKLRDEKLSRSILKHSMLSTVEAAVALAETLD